MDQYERQEKKREAMRTLRAQHRRAGELRRRVVATSVVAFALLWAIVFAQMATGNDPVLSAKSTQVATATRHHRKMRAAGGGGKARVRAEEAASEATERAEKAEAAAIEAEAVGASGAEGIEAEAAEAEAAAATEIAHAETAEIEAAEAEAFVEEPAPVTTSQS